ncbi:hypothetical protein [Paenibacillus gallinarum]|uniref:DUF4440 domain-containing protein n=1 Tax=Paenibacillus gallinarum TaxID=2762232 RepID=A0ABR8T5J0_9BACL|nr:hypothetical protein [Paenibacillus gallinarum]MBD7971026.1 hypothetical protein [Paenibacillus gallinarum]
MIKRNLLFNFNRFSENEVLIEWEKAVKSEDVIVLESINSDWSIEIDGIQSISQQEFESFLSKIDVFDNEVQLYCKEIYEKSSFGAENYIVTLQWISVLKNSITMGYWGDYVNVELRSNIKYENGIWKQIGICYQ